MLQDVLTKIAAPGKEYRSAPFWAWNGKLEPEELRRQIREFKKMGLGGFFMHSRVGLNTEYLGKEWFDCVRACIDEAGKNGLDAWLYDEDRWPSGAAGGLVTRDHRYRSRHLRMLTEGEEGVNAESEELGWFALRGASGGRCDSYRKLAAADAALEAGEIRVHFVVNVARDDSWFNDQAYLDTMNPEAVDEFIRVTHEAYRREIGEDFGKRVPGIFTDEPNYRHGSEGRSMPWTAALPGKFAEISGFALADRLPELFYLVGGEEFSETRLHYYDTVTKLFVDAFSRRIGDWCDRNGMEFTGHVLGEDDVVGQAGVVGSAMRFYEYMQSPGIDLLTEHWNIFLTAKQCVSMARQFGCKSRLSETYGCTGWDFPFMGHKALGDWQLALGINLFCPHLAWYTMAAEAKRDYPASISYQSPWCDEYGAVTGYLGGVAAALSEGEEVRDLLVIHPIESTWAVYPCERDHQDKAWHDAEAATLVHLTNTLLGLHLDFDFGEEEVMSRHAVAEAGCVRINLARYRAVLLPEMRTIRAATLKLLAAFRAAGGLVAYLGDAPQYVGGKRSAEAAKCYREFRQVSYADLDAVLAPTVRRVSIRDAHSGRELDPVLYIQRNGGEFQTLFCCNTAMHFMDAQMEAPLVRDRTLDFGDAEIVWKLPAGLNIYEIDPATGKRIRKTATYKEGAYCFPVSFAALESHLLMAAASVPDAVPETEQKSVAARVTIPAGVAFPIRRSEPNVLLLDAPMSQWDGGAWRAAEPVLKLDDELRAELGKRPRGGAMVQPWLAEKTEPKRTLGLKLAYEIRCRTTLAGDCQLALERPDLYEITLNGVVLDGEEQGYWTDRSLRLIRVPREIFKEGVNRLELTCCYHEGLPGLECCYLLGEFGVYGDELEGVPEVLKRGDWCTQGLQYYSGNVTYRIQLAEGTREGAVLAPGSWRGAAMMVSVNGGKPELVAYPPFEVRLTGLRGTGDEVELTVLGHRRNSHGPFYLKTKWPVWTGPAEYKRYEVATRQLVPVGLQ